MYDLKLPPTTAATFSGVSVSVKAKTNLQIADDVRASFLHQLDRVAGVNRNLEPAIATCLNYLPYLTGICAQYSESKPAVPAGAFAFSWGSTLGRNSLSKENKNFHCYDSPLDELAHVSLVLGILYYQQAFDGLLLAANAEDPTTQRRQALKHLRTAAGVFRFVPCTDTANEMMPLDVKRTVVQALESMALANAQEVLLDTAVDKGMSPALVAKICLGVAAKFAHTRKALGEGLQNDFHSLDPTWNLYLQGKAELYYGLSRYHLALAACASRKYGDQVALLGASRKLLSQCSVPQNNTTTLDMLRAQTAKALQTVSEALTEAVTDNDSVYFMLVPTGEDLKALIPPKGVFQATPITFEPLAPASLLFMEFVEAPAPSMGGGGAAAQPYTPSVPAAKKKNDFPLRTFACARCKGYFNVKCGPMTKVRCTSCQAENMIPN